MNFYICTHIYLCLFRLTCAIQAICSQQLVSKTAAGNALPPSPHEGVQEKRNMHTKLLPW